MRKKQKVTMYLGLLFILILGGCTQTEDSSTEVEEQSVPVEVSKAQFGHIDQSLTVTGDVVADKEVTVTPKISGKVTEILVRKGDIVREGQKLAQLEQTDILNNIKQSEASLQSAQANLANALAGRETGIVQAQEQLTSSSLAVENAQISLNNAQLNYDRTKSLYESGAVPKQQYEQAETALQQAEVGLQQAQSGMRLAEEGVENAKRMENIQTLEAALKQAQVSLETTRSQLDNTIIAAPMGGEITMVYVERGEMASPQAPFVHIIQTNPLLVKTKISEEQLRLVDKGQELEIYIKSVQEKLGGVVRFISTISEEQSRLFSIELEISDAPERMRPGMIAEIHLQPMSESDLIVVPIGALLKSGSEQYVYVVESDRAVKKEVLTGQENSEWVQIVDGLNEGEVVVSKGQSRLAENSLIRIVEGR